MSTNAKGHNHLLTELDDEFDSGDIIRLIRNEAFLIDGFAKKSIWHIGRHSTLISLGELPTIVEDTNQLPPERIEGRITAIVTDNSHTRMVMEILSDALEHWFPIRCRTFRTMEEAHRWLDYLDSEIRNEQ